MEFYTFYNTKVGAISLKFAMVKGALTIQAAPTKNPQKSPKDIKKGEKIFAWEKSIYFSLDIREAKLFKRKVIELLKQGQTTSLDGKPTNEFVLSHFPDENTVTRISFKVVNNAYYFTVSRYHINTKQNESVSIRMNLEDVDVLIAYLDSSVQIKLLSNFGKFTKLYKQLQPNNVNDSNGASPNSGNKEDNNSQQQNNQVEAIKTYLNDEFDFIQ